MNTEARVVIGMDPHKRTVTIEVMTSQELVIGGGRFTTDAEGYAHLLGYARQWPLRIWAIEGCAGIGKHIADRLVTDGEDVVDVPAKLSARVRVLATGQGRMKRPRFSAALILAAALGRGPRSGLARTRWA